MSPAGGSDPAMPVFRGSASGVPVRLTVWKGVSEDSAHRSLRKSERLEGRLATASVSAAAEGDRSGLEVRETFDSPATSDELEPVAYALDVDGIVGVGSLTPADGLKTRFESQRCQQITRVPVSGEVEVPMGDSTFVVPMAADAQPQVVATKTYPESSSAIRYRTFIPAAKASTGKVCGTFKGDNREFSNSYAARNRTRASVFFNWPTRTIDTTKAVGATHRLKANGFSKATKTASSKGIKFHTPMMSATHGKISIVHAVGNPLCVIAGAIRYNVIVEAWKNGSARIMGTRGKVPNREAYLYPKTEANGVKIFTRSSKTFICLSVNCGDESMWVTTP